VTASSDSDIRLLAAAIGGEKHVRLDARLVALAAREGVAPLLADRLRQTGESDPGHGLARAAVQASAVDVVREVELRGAIAALGDRGIPCLVFKGAHLAHAVYPRPDLRPRLDTDLLVPNDRRAGADAALVEHGYERVPQFTGALVAYQAPYVVRRHGRIADVIDLHWRLANPQQFGAVLSTAELFDESELLPGLGEHARAPGCVHALMIACVHPVAHHRSAPLLIWSYDIHLLAARMSSVAWDRLVGLAIERGVARICAHSLRRATELFGIAVPADVTARLEGRAAPEPTARFLAPDRRHIQTIWGDLRTLTSWRDRWRLVRQHAFPPPDYMREVYAPASHRPLMLLYARRMVRGAKRWLARA
jgi:hypothetical protein